MVSAEIVEAREFATRLGDNLPRRIEAAALGVRSKAPFQLLCAREALIWRSEELARNACNALEREDLSVAALLTRSLTENAALVWKLWEILDARHTHSPQQLNDLLIRASRWLEEMGGRTTGHANPELHQQDGQGGAGGACRVRQPERNRSSKLGRRRRPLFET
ncbi:hypothetical protein ACFFNA_22530 [Mesorhizobium kowhaii]|uniref:hypothetical protein n=1 Tax=Mesorhizobium kowhaii TaxID=1300272 RepID=UPI0035ED0218